MIISLKDSPEYLDEAISYLQQTWGSEETNNLYADCLTHTIQSNQPLPQWYLLKEQEKIIGCAGLIPNDFISRMDLMPWLCALYIEEDYRGRHLSQLLVDYVKEDAKALGFSNLYLCTDHIGLYEKQGFQYIGDGYQLSGESIQIYQYELNG